VDGLPEDRFTPRLVEGGSHHGLPRYRHERVAGGLGAFHGGLGGLQAQSCWPGCSSHL
jgi:hypothetical protein